MHTSSSELRARSRRSLSNNWGLAIGGLLIYILVTVVLGLLSMLPRVGFLISLFTAGAITLGLIMFYVGIARGKNPSVSAILAGFNHLIKTFLLYLLITVFTLLWTLLLIVPGIIATYRYSQAYYIFQDNPEMSPLEAIRQSKQLMVGHKWRLFVLQLTFIGWYLLSVLTLGIGLLWLTPYYQVARAHFYDDLTGRSSKPVPPEQLFNSAAY